MEIGATVALSEYPQAAVIRIPIDEDRAQPSVAFETGTTVQYPLIVEHNGLPG